MMITAHKKHHRKRLSLNVKRSIGIESLKEKATIVDISNRFNVSRNSVYKQQAIALTAVNQAFEQTDDDVLYYIPGNQGLYSAGCYSFVFGLSCWFPRYQVLYGSHF